MFTYRRRVFLKDLDATGSIYFGALFNYAAEAFELLLESKKSSLIDLFQKGYLMPIVHAEADYTSPLRISDEVLISVTSASAGTRSVTVVSEIKNILTDRPVGKVTLVHAFVRKGENKSSIVPEELINLLK